MLFWPSGLEKMKAVALLMEKRTLSWQCYFETESIGLWAWLEEKGMEGTAKISSWGDLEETYL